MDETTEGYGYGRGHLAPSRTVKAIVMGQGRGRPPYDWEADDSVLAQWPPPPEDVPGFLAAWDSTHVTPPPPPPANEV